jgi:hypothetical protein
MKFETAADLLTWKNGEVEENMVLEFAQQYEKLTDEEKSELIETAKSAHKEYCRKLETMPQEKTFCMLQRRLKRKALILFGYLNAFCGL